jgi:hypothetical protein
MAISPSKFARIFFKLNGVESVPEWVSPRRYRITGFVMTLWILMMLGIWWTNH